MARSTSVAKSLPFLATADCAPWPATKGVAAASRITDASATSPRRSASSTAIPGLPTHRGERLGKGETSGVERLSDERTLHACVGQRGDGAQIVEAGHA